MRCLIINDMHPSIFPLMEELNIDVDYKPDLSKEELLNCIGEYEGLLVRGTKIKQDILKKANKLQFIGRAGAGLDNIDIEYAEKKGIHLFKAPEGNRDAVAEHTVGMILSLFTNLRKADLEVRDAIWDREGNRGYEIGGKTVGIIGYGNMGEAFAKRLVGFNCKTIAYDNEKTNYTSKWVEEVPLKTLQEQADIVSIHVPLTEITKDMFNYEFFSKFKKPIFLINTARGESLLLADLLQAIEEGKVLGAGLDVLENEKLKTLTEKQQATFKKLVASSRVILSPHVAGWSFESHIKINEVLAQKVGVFLESRR
ncbi:MAG: NAD(P)-dependent oxidoreductase [Cyclobacteriaceae bacterium]